MSKAMKIGFNVAAAVFLVFMIWLGVWALCVPFTVDSAGSVFYWCFVFSVSLGLVIAGFDHPFLAFAPFTVFFSIYLFVLASGNILFNTNDYAHQLKVGESTKFEDTDLPVFDVTQIPWVDEKQAQVLGDKVLGQLGAIGSSVEIGEYTRQDVNGKLYMVAPLLHKSYWAYNKSKQGTPGYIMVSMTNDNDVKLVTQVAGKSILIKYQPSGHAAWGDKLERHIYNYDQTILADNDWMFEIDDVGNPYWVVPYYVNTIKWGAPEVIGVLTVDAMSGEIQKYTIDQAPEWIDRIQPPKFIETQLYNWGHFKDGYFNNANTGRLQSDEGNALVYTEGDCYLFDSLTSVGVSDEATVGFIMINLRTKETKHFDLAGATEYAAQISALGDERVKALNYQAGFPIPVMVEGQPTYFFGLQDPVSGVTKMFALVNIEKHQVVGVGKTMKDVKTDYLSKMRTSGQTSFDTKSVGMVELIGKIVRWGDFTMGGETYYRFVIEGAEDKICITDPNQIEATITQIGDEVKVQVMQTEESVWSVFSFDNLTFHQTQSVSEIKISETETQLKLEEIKVDENIINDDKFKEFFNSLTPEKQQEFMQNLEKQNK